MVYWLPDTPIGFPDPFQGEPDGLFAAGGDLSEERLLLAYHNGIFPWYSFKDSPILWYCPLKRFVIVPSEIHVSHSMRSLINKNLYKVTFNRAFGRVIRKCAKVNGRNKQDGAWLGPDLIEAFERIFDRGYAVSVEVWDQRKLVGGLYGVLTQRCFVGDSMFSLVPNASKLALITLAKRLEKLGVPMIDCQLETPHLKSMGGRTISYGLYLKVMSNEVNDLSEY